MTRTILIVSEGGDLATALGGHAVTLVRADDAVAVLGDGCPDLVVVDGRRSVDVAIDFVDRLRHAWKTCSAEVAIVVATDACATAAREALGGRTAVVVDPFSLERLEQAESAFSLRARAAR